MESANVNFKCSEVRSGVVHFNIRAEIMTSKKGSDLRSDVKLHSTYAHCGWFYFNTFPNTGGFKVGFDFIMKNSDQMNTFQFSVIL